jgi:hypothetical protein
MKKDYTVPDKYIRGRVPIKYVKQKIDIFYNQIYYIVNEFLMLLERE